MVETGYLRSLLSQFSSNVPYYEASRDLWLCVCGDVVLGPQFMAIHFTPSAWL